MNPVMLVVDDEPLLRMEHVGLAEDAGFDTTEASNSAQARKILESRTDIKVVFTDIRMPGDMDGLALAHFIRDRWPPTIIVLCSGNARPSSDDMPVDAVFLPKPCASEATARLLSDIREKVAGAS